MNLEELRKFKEELLARKNQKDSWFIIKDLECFDSSYVYDSLYTQEEIVNLEDTKSLAQKCEHLLEKYTKFLVENDDDVRQVAIGAMPSPIVRKDILNYLKSEGLDDWPDTEESYEEISKYFLKNYVYLDFWLSECNTIVGDKSIADLSYSKDKHLKEVAKGFDNPRFTSDKVSGIVRYDEFIRIMTSLGYKVKFFSGESAQTFDDFSKNCFDFCSLDIVADLSDTKVKSKH